MAKKRGVYAPEHRFVVRIGRGLSHQELLEVLALWVEAMDQPVCVAAHKKALVAKLAAHPAFEAVAHAH